MDQIQFVKDTQWRIIYYSMLGFGALIAFFQLGVELPRVVYCIAKAISLLLSLCLTGISLKLLNICLSSLTLYRHMNYAKREKDGTMDPYCDPSVIESVEKEIYVKNDIDYRSQKNILRRITLFFMNRRFRNIANLSDPRTQKKVYTRWFRNAFYLIIFIAGVMTFFTIFFDKYGKEIWPF